ncbi:MAG: dTDP-4-dehydrorhamnose reductase [Deltaproteobacteria bacterium]|nr:dTDP-4-dehydrorhamnose reductase [Deltaproteobacteria bacterium]
MNLRVLIFGRGLLGQAFARYLPENFERKVLSHSECDIMNFDEIRKEIAAFKPDILVNTSAITDVDYCEVHSREAFIVNSGGAGYIASAARDCGIGVVHISTDYVFDGKKGSPYQEEDAANPLSAYGKSKYEGEQLVSFSGADYLILRVQWLFGEFKDTFIDRAIKNLNKGEIIQAVSNQAGSPTYVKYVVYAASRLIMQNSRGIFHIASEGLCTRYEQMLYICDILKLNRNLVKPVRWDEFQNSAPRPQSIELSKLKLFNATGFRMPDWREQTEEYIKLQYGRRI